MQNKKRIDQIFQNLSNRDNERIVTQFKTQKNYAINFIKHSSEEGVIRNGGRRGTVYGPMAILNTFKKFALTNEKQYFNEIEVSDPLIEKEDFVVSQKSESHHVKNAILSNPADVHLFLGGGHDHIFADLLALEELHPEKKMIIVNLDPHLDMRTDTVFSSGTPFRQFDQTAKLAHDLVQIGPHKYTNVKSSLPPPQKINQKIISFENLLHQTENFNNTISFLNLNFPFNENAVYFLSIDIDVLDSSHMEAVSAVNQRGVNLNFLETIINYFKNDLQTKYFGMYEYNPVFDNLSQKGARSIAHLISHLY
jgi:formiminoglutamase